MPDPGFEVRVDDTVHAEHPDYVALVLLASGLVNGPSDARSEAQLAAAETHSSTSTTRSASATSCRSGAKTPTAWKVRCA